MMYLGFVIVYSSIIPAFACDDDEMSLEAHLVDQPALTRY